jgi:Glycosyltransferase family 87
MNARLRGAFVALIALTLCLVSASQAWAQEEGTAGFRPPIVTVPSVLPATPPDFTVGASDAINTSNEDPRIEALRRERGELSAIPNLASGHWEINYIDEGDAVALVFVDGNQDRVQEVWTGPQVIWPMARGYEGQFGHILNAPYVWIPLAAIFLFGLLDFRRLRRLAHLDLLVLLSFGISLTFFNSADIGVSAPLAYPPLIYLLGRVLWIGFKREGAGLRPSAPVVALLVATVVLCGLRITANVVDSGVIDVGYAGVIGADRITHGEEIYGETAFPENNAGGDTYGPFNYLAYVPFELALPWSGDWDELPAAHAAAIFFDLAAIVGLFFLGRRLRPGRAGRTLGVTLAFAWTAYPFTAYTLQSNANDALIGALLIWGLVGFQSIGWRGLAVALAAAAKFTPIVLVPLFATGSEGLAGRLKLRADEGGLRFRDLLPQRTLLRLAYFGTVLVSILALLYVYPAIDPGLATTWERTIETQLDRESPFSIWGQVTSLQPLQTLLTQVVVVFAAALALYPRRRSLLQAAALAAAVMIAVQLTLEHWFYLYIPWFLGMLLAAIAPEPERERISGAQTSPR